MLGVGATAKPTNEASGGLVDGAEKEELWSPKEAEVNRVYVCRTSLATP